MGKACSDDLRRRVVEAVLAEGMSRHAAAARFGVSVASAVRWVQRFEETGSVSPNPVEGPRPSRLDAHRTWLLGRIEAEPHVTVRRLSAELAARGVAASRNAVWLWLRRNGQTHKKRPARRGAGSR